MKEETKKEVSASKEDVSSIRNFIKHFDLRSTDRLDKALDAFEAESSFENQEKVKVALAEFIALDESGLFKDKMFAPLYESSSKIQYYTSFEEELVEVLEEPKTE